MVYTTVRGYAMFINRIGFVFFVVVVGSWFSAKKKLFVFFLCFLKKTYKPFKEY